MKMYTFEEITELLRNPEIPKSAIADLLNIGNATMMKYWHEPVTMTVIIPGTDEETEIKAVPKNGNPDSLFKFLTEKKEIVFPIEGVLTFKEKTVIDWTVGHFYTMPADMVAPNTVYRAVFQNDNYIVLEPIFNHAVTKAGLKNITVRSIRKGNISKVTETDETGTPLNAIAE